MQVNLIDQARTDQAVFLQTSQSSEAATKISFLIAETIAKKGKPFSGGQLVKDCLQIFTDVVFPDKKSFVENVSLSHQTVARKVDDTAANIEDTLVQRLSACEFYSLALDESTDISDTTQPAIFVRGVAKNVLLFCKSKSGN